MTLAGGLGACMARGLFINSDAWNFFYAGGDWRGLGRDALRREVEKDVDWYVGRGGVEAVFYNLNFQRCFWPTKVGTPYWKDLAIDASGRLTCRGEALADCDGEEEYRRMFLTAVPMWEKFPEFLRYRYEYCHGKGVEMWHSLRVDDCHHVQRGGEKRPQHGDLWLSRPDLRRAEYRSAWRRDWSDRALDYGSREVRDYHLGLVRELMEGYEADGLELDFMRHAPFFKPGYDEFNAPLLTDFVRDVRLVCDEAERKWGHRMRIAVRVPAYPSDAIGLGMDVHAWCAEKLVDVVIPSPAGLETVGDTQVALWRVVAPPPVVLAPCIDYVMQMRWDWRMLFNTPCDLGFAASFYQQGADAVYAYNHYPRDRETHPDMPDFFAAAGDREKVAALPRRCVLTGAGPVGEGTYWRPRFYPWGIAPGASAGGVKINVGEKVAGRTARIVLGDMVEIAAKMLVNGVECELLSREAPLPSPLPGKAGEGFFLQWRIPRGLLHDGWNLAEIVNQSKEPIQDWQIVWLEIDVD